MSGPSSGPSAQELEQAVPRDSGAREIRVGLFVLLGVISFITVLFLLTDPATLRNRYIVVTRLDDAGGVRRGDPVQLRGVNIGRVHGFELTSTREVDVSLEIEGDWSIPVGSSVELAGMGLFGGRTVLIAPSDATTFYEAGDTLPGESGGGNVLDTANDVAVRAEDVLRRVGAVLDEPTVGAIREAMSELQELLTHLNSLAATQREEIAMLTASLNRSAQGLESATGAGPDAARAIARADSTMATLNRASTELEGVAESLGVVLARIERGEGTLGRLSQDETLYANAASATESLRLLIDEFRADPQRFLPRLSIF